MKLPNNTSRVTYQKVPYNGIEYTTGGILTIGQAVTLSQDTINELQQEHQDGYIKITHYETVDETSYKLEPYK